jgi:hypothetical protein
MTSYFVDTVEIAPGVFVYLLKDENGNITRDYAKPLPAIAAMRRANRKLFRQADAAV